MSVQELRELLERIEDTHEIVLRTSPGEASWAAEPLAVWRAARAEANAALEAGRRGPGERPDAGYWRAKAAKRKPGWRARLRRRVRRGVDQDAPPRSR